MFNQRFVHFKTLSLLKTNSKDGETVYFDRDTII